MCFMLTKIESRAVIAAGESPAQLDAAAKVLEMLDAMSDGEPPEKLAERTVERIQKLTSFDAVAAGTRTGNRVQ